jgi:hypothetical protein
VGKFFARHKTSRWKAAKVTGVSIQNLGLFMRGAKYKVGRGKVPRLINHLSVQTGRRWTQARLDRERAKLAAVHPIRENLHPVEVAR